MAGIVADYKVINRGRVRLKIGADSDKTFEFQMLFATRDLLTVVSFMLISSGNLQMTVDIDGTICSNRSYTNGPERCIQDVADGVSSGNHKMTFTVSQGEVLFSDVVLWFQPDADDDGTITADGPF